MGRVIFSYRNLVLRTSRYLFTKVVKQNFTKELAKHLLRIFREGAYRPPKRKPQPLLWIYFRRINTRPHMRIDKPLHQKPQRLLPFRVRHFPITSPIIRLARALSRQHSIIVNILRLRYS